MTPQISDLIKRLEKAVGPDRDLADDVLLACGWSVIEFGALDNPSYEWLAPDESKTFVGGDQPNPLASIDSALTLVPKTHRVADLGEMFNEPGRDWMCVIFNRVVEENETSHPNARAPTPAIALCIAALKARSMEPTNV